MPIVKATATGSNYLQKTNTGADQSAVSALQMYEKQVGSDGATSNTVFTISGAYVLGSNTLMVFVNGQKIEKKTTATDETEYQETSPQVITVGASLLDADVVEFMVTGAYIIDSDDAATLQKFTEVENTDVDTGTETIDSFADTLGDSVFWFYKVKKGTSVRTGIVMAGWDAAGDTIAFTETSTNDVNDTSDLVLAVDIDTNLVRLRATAGSDDWIVKANRMVL